MDEQNSIWDRVNEAVDRAWLASHSMDTSTAIYPLRAVCRARDLEGAKAVLTRAIRATPPLDQAWVGEYRRAVNDCAQALEELIQCNRGPQYVITLNIEDRSNLLLGLRLAAAVHDANAEAAKQHEDQRHKIRGFAKEAQILRALISKIESEISG